MLFVMQKRKNPRIVGEAISAHLRAVQGHYLVVVSTDEQAAKPGFNGRLEVAPLCQPSLRSMTNSPTHRKGKYEHEQVDNRRLDALCSNGGRACSRVGKEAG
jgi:hypothetical protein